MSEADFCYDAGQYYADQSSIEHDFGPDAARDKRIINQRQQIVWLQNSNRKLKAQIKTLKGQIKAMQERMTVDGM